MTPHPGSHPPEIAVGQPFLSVIVPTYARPRQLEACLRTLTSQTFPRDRFEVIVVDDGSPMSLEDVVRRIQGTLDVRLVRQENGGPAAARNFGAAAARGRLLAFTDDDCRPHPGWLEALARAHEGRPQSFLGGTIVNQWVENSYSETSQLILDGAYAFYNRDPDDAEFFASSNIALPADGFDRIGGFSAEFRVASEDRDLCDRWRLAGGRLCSVPSAVVEHARRLRLTSFCRQHFAYGRGAFRFHRERARRRSGWFSRELARYPVFLWTLLVSAARRPARRVIAVLGLLLLAQIVNGMGFAYAATRALGRASP